MQFPPVSSFFHPLRPKYLPLYSDLKYPQLMFIPSMWKTKFQTYTKQYAKSWFYRVSSVWRDCKGKGKAIPIQAWTGPRLRLPDFKTICIWRW
jgi:hypothetical protein